MSVVQALVMKAFLSTEPELLAPTSPELMLKPIWPPLTMAVFTAPVVVFHVSFGRAALLFQARSGLKVLAFKQEKLNLGTSKPSKTQK